MGKIEGQAGLRYENSQSTGYSVTLDSTQQRRIARFFPSLNLSAPLGDKLGWSAAYSNRSDVSDTTMTRAFDLTNVSGASLDFRLWYHIEDLWDYGYIMVS